MCTCYRILFTSQISLWATLNSFPNDKILDWFKLKDFADDKINVTQRLNFILGMAENFVGKEEKCPLPPFSSFPTMFSKDFFLRVVRSQDCVVKGKSLLTPYHTIPIFNYPDTKGFFSFVPHYKKPRRHLHVWIRSNIRVRVNIVCIKDLFEKIEGIGEIAGNQHFLLFQQCFLPFPNPKTSFNF